MHLSTRTILVLLLLLGMATPDSSGSSSPMHGTSQQTATTPPTDGQETSRPNPDASGIYHGGKGVFPPKVIYAVDPQFTEIARQEKLDGTCVVSMVVDRNGIPQDVHVARSIAAFLPARFRSAALGLDHNAINAAKLYKFKPGTYQGKPVPVEINIEINYRIY